MPNPKLCFIFESVNVHKNLYSFKIEIHKKNDYRVLVVSYSRCNLIDLALDSVDSVLVDLLRFATALFLASAVSTGTVNSRP